MMSHEFGTDPVEVARLSTRMLTASQALAESQVLSGVSHAGGLYEISLPESSFGDSQVGSEFHLVYGHSTGHGETMMGRFIGVLEGDCDRLLQTAFAYQAEDQTSGEQLGRIAQDATSAG